MLGGREQLDDAAVVHRLLAVGTAARTGARREHDHVGFADRLGDPVLVRLLEVADDGLGGARLTDRLGMVGIANQRADQVAALVEETGQLDRDLPVASGDHDSHA